MIGLAYDGFEVVPYDKGLNWHHADAQPSLLRALSSELPQWVVYCPECGFYVSSTTQSQVIDLWQKGVVDQRA